MTNARLAALMHRIRDEVGSKELHFKCAKCGVGINKDEETFIINKNGIQVWCDDCLKENR